MAKKKDPSQIGQEEMSVLEYVCQHQPVSVRSVAEHFERFGKARTTILTVMERLRAKKLLSRKKMQGAFHYSSRESQDKIMHGVVGNFVQKMLGGSVSPFIAYLSESEDLSPEDVDELKRLVAEMKQKSGKKMAATKATRKGAKE